VLWLRLPKWGRADVHVKRRHHPFFRHHTCGRWGVVVFIATNEKNKNKLREKTLLVVTYAQCGNGQNHLCLYYVYICIYTLYNRIFGDFPTKNVVYTPYTYCSGQPYTIASSSCSGALIAGGLKDCRRLRRLGFFVCIAHGNTCAACNFYCVI